VPEPRPMALWAMFGFGAWAMRRCKVMRAFKSRGGPSRSGDVPPESPGTGRQRGQ
jgi:hypothetical protein